MIGKSIVVFRCDWCRVEATPCGEYVSFRQFGDGIGFGDGHHLCDGYLRPRTYGILFWKETEPSIADALRIALEMVHAEGRQMRESQEALASVLEIERLVGEFAPVLSS